MTPTQPARTYPISSLTPTVCQLLRMNPPDIATAPPISEVIEAARALRDGPGDPGPIQRCLIYAPDAIGRHLWDREELDFPVVTAQAPLKIAMRSMVPPKTPVCFASIFTGAPPEVHGIRQYERPVLTARTLFDSAIEAGKRVAIVAVKDCSIDVIFRGRALDYYSEPYDPEVRARALELIQDGRHDLIVAYEQEYDDTLHRSDPLGEEALGAARRHLESFDILARAARAAWSGRKSAIVFAPDHGGHLNPETGRGDHGLDIAEDMELNHCYGLYGAA